MAATVWQEYKSKDGNMVKDPIAAALAGGNNPNAGGKWSLNNATGQWIQQPAISSTNESVMSNPLFSSLNSMQSSGSSGSGVGASSIGGANLSLGSISVGTSANKKLESLLSQKPEHSKPNFQVYQPQQMNYQDALGQVGQSYQMRGQDELKDTAQLMSDLEVNPQREAIEQQAQRQELRHHNMMKQVEMMYAGKDQVANELKNKMSKQQAQDLASRGASMRSGLAEYHTAKVNEAVAQQLTLLEINKQMAVENLMSEHGLAMEQIDNALLSLEQQRGKMSSANFEKLNRYEQEMYLQQENARSQIAMHIMDQFMNGEQLKLQSSLAELEAADKKYATEVQAWLGQIDSLLKVHQSSLDASLKGKALELDYLQSLLPYTQLTAKDKAAMDLNWAQLMGRTPR